MENESRSHGERQSVPEPRAQETASSRLPPQGEIFVSAPDAPGANRMLWDLIEEEMHVRRLTLADISRGSGVARQTLLRYRDGKGHSVPEAVLQRLVEYFRSRPPGEGDPASGARWGSSDDVRARIADRVLDPEGAALLHATILGRRGGDHAAVADSDAPTY
jgi:hypothetical protein